MSQTAKALGRSGAPRRAECGRRGSRNLRTRAEQGVASRPGALGAAVGAVTAGVLAAVLSSRGSSLSSEKAEAVGIDNALANSKPSVVEFYADWCDVCKRSASRVIDAKRAAGDDLNLVMLNVDNPQYAQEARQYGVFGIPHFQFVDAYGQPIGSAVGDVPPSILQRQFSQLASGKEIEQAPQAFATNKLPDAPNGDPQVSPRAHSQF